MDIKTEINTTALSNFQMYRYKYGYSYYGHVYIVLVIISNFLYNFQFEIFLPDNVLNSVLFQLLIYCNSLIMNTLSLFDVLFIPFISYRFLDSYLHDPNPLAVKYHVSIGIGIIIVYFFNDFYDYMLRGITSGAQIWYFGYGIIVALLMVLPLLILRKIMFIIGLRINTIKKSLLVESVIILFLFIFIYNLILYVYIYGSNVLLHIDIIILYSLSYNVQGAFYMAGFVISSGFFLYGYNKQKHIL